MVIVKQVKRRVVFVVVLLPHVRHRSCHGYVLGKNVNYTGNLTVSLRPVSVLYFCKKNSRSIDRLERCLNDYFRLKLSKLQR